MNVPVLIEYTDSTMNVSKKNTKNQCCQLGRTLQNCPFRQDLVIQILIPFHEFFILGKRRFNIKLWKTFTDCFNCLPIAAIVDEKIFCCHGGLSPDLQSMEQIRRIMRPTDVPDTGEIYYFAFFFQSVKPCFFF